MKRKIIVLGLFVGCLIALSFTTENKNLKLETANQDANEQITKPCVAPPDDRNCNGIPDWMEIDSNEGA